jgi:hypothetical protein
MRRMSIPVVAAAALVSGSALALPAQCQSSNGHRGYKDGYDLENGLLNHIWNTRFACNTLEEFIAAVNVQIDLSPSSDPYLQCRNVGIADAVVDAMGYRQSSCGAQCYDNGSSIGEKAAVIYCGLPPLMKTKSYSHKLCTITSRQGCNSALRSLVQARCAQQAAADPGFESYVEAACRL